VNVGFYHHHHLLLHHFGIADSTLLVLLVRRFPGSVSSPSTAHPLQDVTNIEYQTRHRTPGDAMTVRRHSPPCQDNAKMERSKNTRWDVGVQEMTPMATTPSSWSA
jgi:hypothetical protein